MLTDETRYSLARVQEAEKPTMLQLQKYWTMMTTQRMIFDVFGISSHCLASCTFHLRGSALPARRCSPGLPGTSQHLPWPFCEVFWCVLGHALPFSLFTSPSEPGERSVCTFAGARDQESWLICREEFRYTQLGPYTFIGELVLVEHDKDGLLVRNSHFGQQFLLIPGSKDDSSRSQ
jgi:hypothetical protein